ncbi:hypothetical protein RHGRI_005347 [Rhododendron griersonianum]|uniref:Uncharacterized protein n=1 Tax=Rhododendron griersonianum TaxID=479676 RepID=A0AAV6LCZ5_9ERIC|nr:hypothetical protein RHGRI_005347 [Rhododendron griersonianum]
MLQPWEMTLSFLVRGLRKLHRDPVNRTECVFMVGRSHSPKSSTKLQSVRVKIQQGKPQQWAGRIPRGSGGMDRSRGSDFGNNENTGANNFLGIFGDVTNYHYGDLYNNVNHVNATSSSNANQEIWSGLGSGAPFGSTSNAGRFCSEETKYGSPYGGTGHGSSSN